MMSAMIERVARAIEGVQLFSRRNDLLTPPKIEVCRYGGDGEPEIVVLQTFDWGNNESEALSGVVRAQRARAAIEAMREPTEAQILAAHEPHGFDDKITVADVRQIYRDMIDMALNDNPAAP